MLSTVLEASSSRRCGTREPGGWAAALRVFAEGFPAPEVVGVCAPLLDHSRLALRRGDAQPARACCRGRRRRWFPQAGRPDRSAISR
jgi:hypothetical protein